jgi:ketosteroid isomerase-like protein
MSQENLELAKRLHAMALAGDIDGVLALTADDFVATEIRGALDEPSVFHGREAAASHWAALVEVFDDLHWEVNEWLDVGDWVITVGRWKGRGKESGAEVEGRTANAERWRDGKLVEMLLGLGSKAKALDAVGLRE